MGGMLGMLPGHRQDQEAAREAKIDESSIKRQEAIISSMTKASGATRADQRLAQEAHRRGLGRARCQDVNRLLKQHADMAEMMKRMKKLGQKGLMRTASRGMTARRRASRD